MFKETPEGQTNYCPHARPDGQICPHCLGINRTDKIDLEGSYDEHLLKCPNCEVEMVKVDEYSKTCPKCHLTFSKG